MASLLYTQSIDEAKDIFERLHAGLDGYKISHEARRNHPNKKEVDDAIYGEAKLETIRDIFSEPAVKQYINTASNFYDLGSGIGNVVHGVYLLGLFENCYGIELFEHLYNTSLKQAEKLYNMGIDVGSNVHFFQDNILSFDLSDADVVFLNYPIKNQETAIKLDEHLAKSLKKGALVIYNIHSISNDHSFQMIKEKDVKFGWGNSSVRYYVKK